MTPLDLRTRPPRSACATLLGFYFLSPAEIPAPSKAPEIDAKVETFVIRRARVRAALK